MSTLIEIHLTESELHTLAGALETYQDEVKKSTAGQASSVQRIINGHIVRIEKLMAYVSLKLNQLHEEESKKLPINK